MIMIKPNRIANLLLALSVASHQTRAQSSQLAVNRGNVNLTTCENIETQFDIQLVYMGEGSPDPRYEEAFELAAKRWSKIIVGDEPDIPLIPNLDWFQGVFPGRPFVAAVDDVVIGYNIPSTIDGPGGVLGQAGPVTVRRDRLNRPTTTISGIMEFDGSDLDRMPANDVKLIVAHEMAHVLGLIGTTTSRCNQQCNPRNTAQSSFLYNCLRARVEYSHLLETVTTRELPLLLENQGGAGTACGHFEDRSFRTIESSELMTGFFQANLWQPISSVTVAALQDLGYTVDFCGADIWPADANSIKRFEVFVASQTMQGVLNTTVIDEMVPSMGILPETMESVSFSEMDFDSSPVDEDLITNPSGGSRKQPITVMFHVLPFIVLSVFRSN